MEYSFDIMSHLPKWNWQGILLIIQVIHVVLSVAYVAYMMLFKQKATQQPQVVVHVNTQEPETKQKSGSGNVTCRRCGKPGLKWGKVHGKGWRTFENGKEHSCGS